MRAAQGVAELALADVAGGANRYEITRRPCSLAPPVIVPVQLLEEDILLRVPLVLVHLQHVPRLVALGDDDLVLAGGFALAGVLSFLEGPAVHVSRLRLGVPRQGLPALRVPLAVEEELLAFLYPSLYSVVVFSLPLIWCLAAVQVLTLNDRQLLEAALRYFA